jgi:hypothetical protein
MLGIVIPVVPPECDHPELPRLSLFSSPRRGQYSCSADGIPCPSKRDRYARPGQGGYRGVLSLYAMPSGGRPLLGPRFTKIGRHSRPASLIGRAG